MRCLRLRTQHWRQTKPRGAHRRVRARSAARSRGTARRAAETSCLRRRCRASCALRQRAPRAYARAPCRALSTRHRVLSTRKLSTSAHFIQKAGATAMKRTTSDQRIMRSRANSRPTCAPSSCVSSHALSSRLSSTWCERRVWLVDGNVGSADFAEAELSGVVAVGGWLA